MFYTKIFTPKLGPLFPSSSKWCCYFLLMASTQPLKKALGRSEEAKVRGKPVQSPWPWPFPIIANSSRDW